MFFFRSPFWPPQRPQSTGGGPAISASDGAGLLTSIPAPSASPPPALSPTGWVEPPKKLANKVPLVHLSNLNRSHALTHDKSNTTTTRRNKVPPVKRETSHTHKHTTRTTHSHDTTRTTPQTTSG